MKTRENIQKMTMIAAVTAIIIICAWVTIPMPSGVGITLQTFGVALCGFVLGAKYSAVSVMLYWAIGAVGLPVFSGFRGGVGQFVGPTGGFLWGFLFLAVLCGLAKSMGGVIKPMLLAALGLILCHALGIVQYAGVANQPLINSFLGVSLPYLLKDGISVVLAWLIGAKVLGALKASKKTA